MISCTEFIPLYSELFKYLYRCGGDEAVMEYWLYLSEKNIGDLTNPNSLGANCARLGGFEGAMAYWGHTLGEEACDVCRIINPKEQYIYSHMRHCPSMGMLNDLHHVKPYHDYCKHCDVIYEPVLKKYGMTNERLFCDPKTASCASIKYPVGKRPTIDFTKPTPDCKVDDLKSEGAKYLHRDFHISGDFALEYLGAKFGCEGVCGFLCDYARYYYAPIIEGFKRGGLTAVRAWLTRLYEVEEASEVLHTELSDAELKVTIDKSPAIEFMHSVGQKPSKYYIEQTRTLYAAMADGAGLGFSLDFYDAKTGKATYRFYKK